MTKVLVAGGGVAGCATALALHQAGIPAVVYEAHPSGGDDAGAFLTVMANGMAALEAIGAGRRVVDASYPAGAVELFDAEGRHLRHRAIEGPARTLRRATLYRVLQDLAAARGIRVAHGKRMTDARPADGGSGVEVWFADGDHAEGDILVGADGIHSRTRHLIDRQAPTPRYTGQHVVYGYADGNPVGSAPDAYHMVFGTRAFFGFTAPGDGRTWWFARVTGERGPGDTTAEQSRDLALAAVRDDATPAAAIIEATGLGEVVGGDSYDIRTTPHWHDDRMVLVGDAAHAASPAAAQGASMALEDAVALAAALREHPDPAAAFSAYTALRRRQTEETVAASAQLAREHGSST
ncbi:2-polyprenyl-6-methoxyphenol hydroxylase [Actinopolymorpha cephalotaxi]|uniref:2-polyprenyl-6-methoxyphenol hydroxylase n=1 Tax=Actinopolymorpha cephalotaxi TaxID=504797 RepID=A0A1I2Y1X3_9ACTN|nr:FAD-dependent monooxygenase [Actinopolymorpha cephalotaxi]NYH87266.1 2-polyprenyl-6-methoxyphenol hydroxylase-like FAD-dependent oxidoreductase [Actinopolymorpha cephalotaxi]SFH18956.1 2-polyprenyl-6-methoxyphenol hydroxylase [Actinopolymorpha cephalotaxi]